MKHHLHLLRSLRGLGFTSAELRFQLKENEAVEVKVVARRPGSKTYEAVDAVPIHDIDPIAYSDGSDFLSTIFDRFERDFRDALNREHMFVRPDSGTLRLSGFCKHCGKSVACEFPKG